MQPTTELRIVVREVWYENFPITVEVLQQKWMGRKPAADHQMASFVKHEEWRDVAKVVESREK